MLKSNLLRVTLRKGRIYPKWLDPNKSRTVELAEALIELFQSHLGRSKGELNEALKDFEGTSQGFRLMRGLALLLERRCEVAPASERDFHELRRVVFEKAAAARSEDQFAAWEDMREQVLEEAAQALEIESDTLSAHLYGDLKDRHVIHSFECPSATALIEHYNLALVQGLLLSALGLEITISQSDDTAGAAYRSLFRAIKFQRLLHDLRRHPEGGFVINLDGPLAALEQSRRYGFQLAAFLPNLVRLKDWRASARVLWGQNQDILRLELSHKDGLIAKGHAKGVYLTDTHKNFLKRFEKLGQPWTLSSSDLILPLGGQDVWFPDFKATHPDGREAYLEVIGYWRTQYLARRIDLLKRVEAKNLILIASKKLKVDKEALEATGVPIIWFKQAILPKSVRESLEEHAHLPLSAED